jgi:UDP-N-acetylglucosamine--N-acetylmuramyl-(pentapeptide) pyrophosphoryl-undecaprenol N-acetylglucosamine transferase
VPAERVDGPPRLLIFGGSQGAHPINVAMVAAAPVLAGRGLGLEITHQTGERDLELVKTGYRAAGVAARVEPFLFDMAREMRLADLVVCRSGATTIAELTASGRPAIFIPLPTAADDHQRVNAMVLVAAGAAEVIEQQHLTGDRLAGRIAALAEDQAARAAMSAAAHRLAHPDAAGAIVERVLELAKRAGA